MLAQSSRFSTLENQQWPRLELSLSAKDATSLLSLVWSHSFDDFICLLAEHEHCLVSFPQEHCRFVAVWSVWFPAGFMLATTFFYFCHVHLCSQTFWRRCHRKDLHRRILLPDEKGNYCGNGVKTKMENSCVGRKTCNAGALMLHLRQMLLQTFICVQNGAVCSRTALRIIIRKVLQARGSLSRESGWQVSLLNPAAERVSCLSLADAFAFKVCSKAGPDCMHSHMRT